MADDDITAGTDARITLSYRASQVYLVVGGSGSLTATDGDGTRTVDVSGPPDIRTVASQETSTLGTVTVTLSPGVTAYSFTFG